MQTQDKKRKLSQQPKKGLNSLNVINSLRSKNNEKEENNSNRINTVDNIDSGGGEYRNDKNDKNNKNIKSNNDKTNNDKIRKIYSSKERKPDDFRSKLNKNSAKISSSIDKSLLPRSKQESSVNKIDKLDKNVIDKKKKMINNKNVIPPTKIQHTNSNNINFTNATNSNIVNDKPNDIKTTKKSGPASDKNAPKVTINLGQETEQVTKQDTKQENKNSKENSKSCFKDNNNLHNKNLSIQSPNNFYKMNKSPSKKQNSNITFIYNYEANFTDEGIPSINEQTTNANTHMSTKSATEKEINLNNINNLRKTPVNLKNNNIYKYNDKILKGEETSLRQSVEVNQSKYSYQSSTLSTGSNIEQPTYLHYDLKIGTECSNKILDIIENIKEVLNLTLKDHIDSSPSELEINNINNLNNKTIIGSELNFLKNVTNINLSSTQKKEKIILDKRLKMNLVAQEIETVNSKACNFNDIMSNLLKKQESQYITFKSKQSVMINLDANINNDNSAGAGNQDLNVSKIAKFFNKSNINQKIKKIENESEKRINIYNNMFEDCTKNIKDITEFIKSSIQKQEAEEKEKENIRLKNTIKESKILKKIALFDKYASHNTSLNNLSNLNNLNNTLNDRKSPFASKTKNKEVHNSAINPFSSFCRNSNEILNSDKIDKGDEYRESKLSILSKYRESMMSREDSMVNENTTNIFIPSSNIHNVNKHQELNMGFKVLRKELMIYNEQGYLESITDINDSYNEEILKIKDFRLSKIIEDLYEDEDIKDYRSSIRRSKSVNYHNDIDNNEEGLERRDTIINRVR